MDSASPHPRRHQPAHFTPVEKSNRTTIIFLTICVARRRPLLARPEISRLLVETLRESTHWLVGRYVILPDHLHLFCAPGVFPPRPLKAWIGYWQNMTTRHWPHPEEKPIWQKDYWDRQLRRGDSYGEKWHYVANNPVRHGLVADASAWPYQGEINVLQWHEP